MRFVHDDEKILGEIIEEARRPLAGFASRQMTRVVLNAGACADLEHHFDVEVGSRLETLRLEKLAGGLQLGESFHELGANETDRALESRAVRDEVLRRVNGRLFQRRDGLAGQHIYFRNPLDLLFVCRKDLDGISAHAKRPALERDVVPAILDSNQGAEDFVARDLLTLGQRDHLLTILDGIAQAINRRDRGDDDHVLAFHETRRRAKAQPVNVLVDRGVLFNIRVGRRNVRFRLVIVVVRDEIFDGVVREEALQLPIQLSGERFVMRHHERRPPVFTDDVGH